MWNAVGLVLDIIGALMLAWGEMAHIATFIREGATEQPPSDFTDLEWYMKFPFWIAKRFGPTEHGEVIEPHFVIKGFSINLWALLLIVLGFVF